MPVQKGPGCVSRELELFRKGQLHSGKDGAVVKDKKHALAVALSVCGESKYSEFLRGLGFSEKSSDEVVALFAELDWAKQFETGVGPGPEKKENFDTGVVHLKGLVGARIGKKGPGNMGKLKVNSDASSIAGPALPRGPGNPMGGSSKDVQGLRMLG